LKAFQTRIDEIYTTIATSSAVAFPLNLEDAVRLRPRPKFTSPWRHSRKMKCAAHVPSPLSEEKGALFRGLHSSAMIKVTRRHIKNGWILIGVEWVVPGCRIDLVFAKQGRIRVVEVKSANRIREVDKLQTALLSAFVDVEEYVVSNGREDQILDQSFVEQALMQADDTHQFLIGDPSRALGTYTPHEDVCYTCSSESCPYHRDRTACQAKENVLA